MLIIYQIFISPLVKRWAIITYKQWYIRIASRVAERLKSEDLTQLGNIMKASQLHRIMLRRPAKLKILLILEENSWQTEMKLFL